MIYNVFLLLFIPIISFSQGKWVVPEENKNIKNPYPKTEELTIEGEKIYRALCLTCHGEFGDGNLNPPSISFKSNLFLNQQDGEIFYKISNGRGMMMPYKYSLNEKQRWLLVNYLKTFINK